MTRPAALLRCALCLGSLVAVAVPLARAQALRVAVGDREFVRAEASTLFGHAAFPVTLLARLGADVRASRADVVVRLFGDTLRFRPGQPGFEVNGQPEPLDAWTYMDEGVLFVAQSFFTRWLPSRYPGRLAYRDGVLRIAAPSQLVAARRPDSGEVWVPAARGDAGDPLAGALLGFIDARLFGVFDSNVDRDPVPRSSFGTVARVGVGIQSARVRPFLTARYDFAIHRFVHSDDWNRATHDVNVEFAPSLRSIRLRLGAAAQIGSLTEDRELSNQVVLRPQIEIRPTPAHVLNVYVMLIARRIHNEVESRRDTFLLAGAGYYVWWRGGGIRVDGRYDVNKSELETNRYAGWTGRAWTQIPVPASHRLTLDAEHNRRRYAWSFVDQAGTIARADRRWIWSVSLTRELAGPAWEVGLKYVMEDNRSNNTYAVYEARRVELMVRRRW